MNAIRLGLLAWMGLIVLQPIWYAWLAPPANGRIGLALLLTLLPLLAPMLAMYRGPRRALLWVGIASLGYFVHGVVALWSEPAARLCAAIEVGLCVLLSIALIGIVRSDRANARKP